MKEMLRVRKDLVPGDCVSGMASRIRVSLDKVGCKNLKTLGAQQHQECSDISLPAEMKTGGAVSKMLSGMGLPLTKEGVRSSREWFS